MSRGFHDAGFGIRAAVEWDLAAAATYAANFGERITHCCDVAEFREIPSVDVVIGGPPCQGFSNLGKRDPHDARNRLWREFRRVVLASECRLFVLENVDRFASSREARLLELDTRPWGRLRDFDLQVFDLNAADFGVAQRRRRTIIVGSRVGPIDVPKAAFAETPGRGQSHWRTLREVISDFSLEPPTTDLPHSIDDFFGVPVPGPFKLDDLHVGRTYRPESIERYALIAPGRSRLDLPDRLQFECWKGHTTGARDVLGRLEWDRPSVTIRTEFFKPEKGRYLHPQWSATGRQVNRALTHAEAAVLQGFDERHQWCGTKIAIARQIGNAVPPPLAEAVAKAVKKRLKSPVLSGA